ncbi:MAG: PHP domain-containing protein, partial [Christensenellales bacterium]|nr:PHP domain-containing protein [Christensenellales bacterium]
MQNLHAHSVFCDGKNTPEEMIRACLAAGMDSAGISIHSPLPFANGWAAEAENVAPFLAEMRRLKAAYAGRIAVYAGVEWDVLSDAGWLEPFDYAIGSA